MDANYCHEISDTSDETVRILSDLIEVSRTDEQMIYREAEIDEFWRLLDARRGTARSEGLREITATLAVVMEVHDLLERAENAPAAARKLRALVE